MRMGRSIHVIGSMMIDRVSRVRALPRAGETVVALSSSVHAGGKGANQAAAAAKCGARVRMLGRTGRDGAFIVDALRAARVDVDAISTTDAVSGAATVLVAESGENAIVIAPESNTRLVLAEIAAFLEPAAQGDIVLFQNECSCLHDGIAHAAARQTALWKIIAAGDLPDDVAGAARKAQSTTNLTLASHCEQQHRKPKRNVATKPADRPQVKKAGYGKRS